MYDKSRHYALEKIKWDAEIASVAIQDIVNDVSLHLNSSAGLPAHPSDEWPVQTDLYFGLAGVLWALHHLSQSKICHVENTYSDRLDHLLIINQKEDKLQDYPENSSYFFGELPLLLLKFKTDPNEELKSKIYASIKMNSKAPVRELMWGMAGSMLCANFMYTWTKEARWKEVFLEQMDLLLADLIDVDCVGFLWKPQLGKVHKKYLGAMHGFVGNSMPLIQGSQLMLEDKFSEVCSIIFETIVNTAQSNENYANWPVAYDEDNKNKSCETVQICHGAPGIVSFLTKLPVGKSQKFDEILMKAAELIWMLGPVKKGSNLCHGTAGNGYAFLKMFDRTHDETWLERARAFAMNAIKQQESEKKQFHQGRYTLWTGDLGLAIFLENCILGKSDFPTIDVF